MKIAIGSDHAGYGLKEQIKAYLKSLGYEVKDEGTFHNESVDYPDFSKLVGNDVKSKTADFGILVCYTGIGMSISANKIRGIRAALVTNVENARLTREHNDANVLCLGAKDVDEATAFLIVDTFLNAKFLGGRHANRVNKITELENEF